MPASFATCNDLSRDATPMGLAYALGDEANNKNRAAAIALALRHLQQAFAYGFLREKGFQVSSSASAPDAAGLSLGEQKLVSGSMGTLNATPNSDMSGVQGLVVLMGVFVGPAAGESHEPQRALSNRLGDGVDSACVTASSATQTTDLSKQDPIEVAVLPMAGMQADDGMPKNFVGVPTEDAAKPGFTTELPNPSFRQDSNDVTPQGKGDSLMLGVPTEDAAKPGPTIELPTPSLRQDFNDATSQAKGGNLMGSEMVGHQAGSLCLEGLAVDCNVVPSLQGQDPCVVQPFFEPGPALDQIPQSPAGPKGDLLVDEPPVAQPLPDAGKREADAAGYVGVDEANNVAILAALQDLLAQALAAEEATLRARGGSVATDAELPEWAMIGALALAAPREWGPKPKERAAPRADKRAVAPARRRPRVARRARARVQRRTRRPRGLRG